MTLQKNFSNRLKQLRIEKGKTQKEIADFLNLTVPAYGFYEQGRNFPNIEIICKIADYFNVSVDYLIGRDFFLNNKQH